MNIIVPVKLVPDLVEELKIDAQGLRLDPDWLRLKLNEFDDHAIEQAILLKERGAATVTVVALDDECTDEVLYTAAAKGADRLLKLTGAVEAGQTVSNHALAEMLAPLIQDLQPDLVLTGVQAHNDLDGPLGPLLAESLEWPYVGYVAGVQVSDGQATIRKEFPGGLVACLEVKLPAVFGIQAAEQPPRYVAFSKIRQASKTVKLEEQPAQAGAEPAGPLLSRMYQPESGNKAEMIPGDADQVAAKLVEILTGLGVI
jgi:electron transfer flavoprotein beta subunit